MQQSYCLHDDWQSYSSCCNSQAAYARLDTPWYWCNHLCRHLHLQSSYRQAIEDTLSRGGDTDTNAAIVGGMIGALHGVNKISEHLRSKVFSRDPAQGNPRPEFLHPGQVPSMAKQLYQMGLQQKDKAWQHCFVFLIIDMALQARTGVLDYRCQLKWGRHHFLDDHARFVVALNTLLSCHRI